ncbi:hypothetical protein [Synechococcus phage S-N03]|uniref:Uncharacterized protein n=1 Tax=Synechococcus phage S-N03 TaxID=2718943 RepID=A0A6G8R643_9CAUD|nr:hypothetical protein PQC09_gp207 [Synechococcus phage S-N03]QIN96860.1 hypothetical protein [Synechococcus phage S-N03]
MSRFTKLIKGGKGFLAVAFGTFLSLQVAPTVSLAVYQNLMTPWANSEDIERLQRQVIILQHQVEVLEHLLRAAD